MLIDSKPGVIKWQKVRNFVKREGMQAAREGQPTPNRLIKGSSVVYQMGINQIPEPR